MSGFNLNSLFSEETIKNRSKNVQVVEVGIDKIESNFHNFYPIRSQENSNEFEALKVSIDKDGLLSPILLLESDDGSYRVISGHRRLEVHRQLGKETIGAIIDSTDTSSPDEEQIKIISANIQREKTPEIIKIEVEKLSVIFDTYKENRLIPEGMLKRDWIGLKIGRTGRTVQKYLNPLPTLEENEEQTSLFEKPEKPKKTYAQKVNDKLISFSKSIDKVNDTLDEYSISDQEEVVLRRSLEYIQNKIGEILNNHF